MRIREPLASAFIRGYRAKQGQTNPRDLDAEMITRLPVATAEDHRQLFTAIDGVVGGMQGATRVAAGPVGRRDSPRPAPNHTVEDDPGAGFMNTVTTYMVSPMISRGLAEAGSRERNDA